MKKSRNIRFFPYEDGDPFSEIKKAVPYLLIRDSRIAQMRLFFDFDVRLGGDVNDLDGDGNGAGDVIFISVAFLHIAEEERTVEGEGVFGEKRLAVEEQLVGFIAVRGQNACDRSKDSVDDEVIAGGEGAVACDEIIGAEDNVTGTVVVNGFVDLDVAALNEIAFVIDVVVGNVLRFFAFLFVFCVFHFFHLLVNSFY